MTDERPRPAYGEYATPEEQRARIAQPDATYALETGQAVVRPAPSYGAAPAAPPAVTSPPARPRVVDRIVTLALLAYGLFNVAITITQLLNFGAYAESMMEILGVDGSFTNVDAGRFWGTIAAVVMGVGWLVTAFLSWRRLRRGRLTWWVPVVGAAATVLVVSLLTVVPLLGDPAIMGYFQP